MNDIFQTSQKTILKQIITILISIIIMTTIGFIIYQSISQDMQNIVEKNKRLTKQYYGLSETLSQYEKNSETRLTKLENNSSGLWKANNNRQDEIAFLETRVVTAQQGLNRIAYVFLRSLDYDEEAAWQMANEIALNPTVDCWDTIVDYIPVDVEAIQQDLAFTALVAKVDALSFDIQDNKGEINATNARINFLVEHQEEAINKFLKEHSTWLTGLILKTDD